MAHEGPLMDNTQVRKKRQKPIAINHLDLKNIFLILIIWVSSYVTTEPRINQFTSNSSLSCFSNLVPNQCSDWLLDSPSFSDPLCEDEIWRKSTQSTNYQNNKYNEQWMRNDGNFFRDTSQDTCHDLWLCISSAWNNPAGDYISLPFPGNQLDCCIILESNYLCSIDQDLVLKKSEAPW